MDWFFLALIATALWASCNLIDKFVVSEYVTRPIVCVAIAGCVGLVFALIELLSFRVHMVAIVPLVLSLLAGFLFIAGLLLYFEALSTEEVTRIVPVMQLSPVITIILSVILLDETLGIGQYAGIALILCGALTASIRKEAGQELRIRKSFG